ncbi:Cys-tRNA(Pro) deacylase [Isoptericola jiangsuensis]|uniref:Cys-tRNA(Pro) deacylase n=1 Tax=Isoptericola jiangsuensis TaxID=548579 RepID=UPI000BF2B7B3|nr:Cys-tRNA(Pro) deacylase [Isoptericola jiangsuensis]
MAKKTSRAQAGTPAILALDRAGVPYALHPYEHDPASDLSYGLEAAAALGADPAQVFKTLLADVDGALVVGVVPVAGSLDLKALARAVGGKRAVMADPGVAQRATGYVVGGISPLGQKQRLRTVLDSSATAFDAVYVSAGRRGLDLSLAPTDLLRLTGGVTADVGR